MAPFQRETGEGLAGATSLRGGKSPSDAILKPMGLHEGRQDKRSATGCLTVTRGGHAWIVDAGFQGASEYGLAGGTPLFECAARIAHALLLGAKATNWQTPRPWWIEVGTAAFSLLASEDVTFALAGASRVVRVDERPVAGGQPVALARGVLRAGQSLELGPSVSGFSSCVTFDAKWSGSRWFDSCATCLGMTALGIRGRYLASADVLPVCPDRCAHEHSLTYALALPPPCVLPDGPRLRYLAAAEHDDIVATWADANRHHADGLVVTVTSRFDAQGIGLSAPTEALGKGPGLPQSSPTVVGLIQWPTSGHPMILGPSRQTVGGYARFGVVIRPDVMRLGLLRPGQRLKLTPVSRAFAKESYQEFAQQMRVWETYFGVRGVAEDHYG